MLAARPSTGSGYIGQVLPGTGSPLRSQYFAPTGKVVRGTFLSTFERFGLERIGYPISDEHVEGGLTVQWFERARMEYHPELAGKGYAVLFTRLGAELNRGNSFARVSPFQSTGTRVYVKETGHSLAEPFLSYWKANGGIELFGYPISEPLNQDGLTVQWFERARMEYHPELAGKGEVVQLGLLGTMAYERAGGELPVKAQTVSEGKAPSADPELTANESYLLRAINQQRVAAGLQPVQLDPTATGLARERSSDMAVRNYFSHYTPEGKTFLPMLSERGFNYRFAGEILARNNYPDADAARIAMESYMNSAPHRAIILDARFTLVGVGYALSDEDRMHYFTVIFVQP
jgi:uncharacterized protein YkwD